MKKIEKQKNGRKKDRNIGMSGMSIRLQLIIGFLVPVFFIVAVGIISYLKASSGLTANYEKSSMTALEMTVTSLEESMQTVMTATSELSSDTTVMSYALGGFDSDSTKQSQAVKNIRNNMSVKETSSNMMEAIHVIPVDGDNVITTKTLGTAELKSFIADMPGSEDGDLLSDGYIHWGTTHPFIDEQMGLDGDDYILYCSKSISSGSNQALVVIDISTEAVLELLQKLDVGEGAQVSFITDQGMELKCGSDISIADTAFYKEGKEAGTDSSSQYVNYEGKSYYFMMCKSNITKGYVAVMVPKAVITQSSKDIERITIVMVVAACLIALLTSTVIISNITRNIAKSVAKLGRVSEGELLEEPVKATSKRNEFGELHQAIRNTISRIRELVLTVKRMIEAVSASDEKVNESSKNVGNMVQDVSGQIEEILHIIEKEDKEISSCNEQMEKLSVKIKTVSESILDTMEQIDNSRQMITLGINAVTDMTGQSKETALATDEVQKQVLLLGGKLKDIETFVESIQSIAEETNLLSLNASIEAARAGEEGKGFSVVAEEIRKLADNSAKTASAIQDVIEEIRTYSESAADKVKQAEAIVTSQEDSVSNTSVAFSSMNEFMEKLMENMREVTESVEEMNRERKGALASIRTISDLSGDTVHSANQVSSSLEQQIASVDMLEQEAKNLEQNMRELETAVAGFKLV